MENIPRVLRERQADIRYHTPSMSAIGLPTATSRLRVVS